MAKFLGLVRVSAEEASKMVHDGPAARRDYITHLVRQAGGEVEGMWLTNVGDWDMVLLLDMGDLETADGAAATLARRAAGLSVAERWLELVEVDSVQTALESKAR